MYMAASYRTASELNTAMADVYKHMALAVATSMLVSYLVSSNAAVMAVLFGTELKWLVIFAPIVAVFAIGMVMSKISATGALACLHGFAALMGLSMSALFMAYTSMSITSAFMSAAVLFGCMSFYGYFTKRDLEGWGKWLIVGLIGIVIASIINVFLGNSTAQTVISALGVIIFTGMTAYDTQRIRQELSTSTGGNVEIYASLSLYMNFINLFMSLLQLFGTKEE